MAKLDPEQERRRLAEFYAGQLDGELEKVAAQTYELTEVARDALRAEMSRRGLEFTLLEQPPVPPQKSSRNQFRATLHPPNLRTRSPNQKTAISNCEP
jgi:hypothetical protein